MEYLLKLSDASGRHMVVLSLKESTVKQPAIDTVFDVIGADDPNSLVEAGILSEGLLDEFGVFQNIIFGKDKDGSFIRDDINFMANGKELNPDTPFINVFVPAQKEGLEYRRCDLLVSGGAIPEDDITESGGNVISAGEAVGRTQQAQSASSSSGQGGSMAELGDLLFLHQIAVGNLVEVTKDYPELIDIIARAEKDALVEIDVKKAAYKLTEKGKRRHDSYIEEAQSLIKRYDIYGDVDVDSNGVVHFDTELGQDLRVPIYEVEGVDPFRARFLLGLNDGEWDKMDDWVQKIEDEEWYREIFKPIEAAPSVDEIGKGKLEHILDRGKAKLRSSV